MGCDDFFVTWGHLETNLFLNQFDLWFKIRHLLFKKKVIFDRRILNFLDSLRGKIRSIFVNWASLRNIQNIFQNIC